MSSEMNRRNFVTRSMMASALAACADVARPPVQAAETPTGSSAAGRDAATSQGGLPRGKIGDFHVSRLLLGGNLLTHATHSRDLRYVSSLAAHYNTPKKILETLEVAEANGINTLVIHTVPAALKVLQEHRKRGGKIQWIICPTSPIVPGLAKYGEHVQRMVDDGVDAIYVWGCHGDELVCAGKVDLLGKAVDLVKSHGLLCGVGAHALRVVQACEKNKIRADFYIKTFHHHNFPSAPKPGQADDNYSEVPSYWCGKPEETAQFMKGVEKPWIAFKVMAAGAIPPQDAFRYAFQNGADFVLAGMFDFEIAEDVAIARKLLAEVKSRARPWRG
jgi:hypothetical protein